MRLVKKFARLTAIVPFRLTAALLLAFIGLAAIAAVVIPLMGVDWMAEIAPIGVILILALVILPFMALVSRGHLQDIEQILNGEYLAHWVYNADEWRKLVNNEAKTDKRNAMSSAVTIVLVGIVMMFLGFVIKDKKSGASFNVVAMWIGLALAAMGIVAGLLIYYFGNGAIARRSKQGEVYISKVGVYQLPGGYIPLYGFGIALAKVELIQDDQTALRFECLVKHQSSSSNYTSIEQMANITVPAGREAEARQVLEYFQEQLNSRKAATVQSVA